MKWPWYLTATAVREYQAICGLPAVDDGAQFDAAEEALGQLSFDARLARDEGHRQIWRATVQVRGKSTRLELTVSTARRVEGALPQLVRVTAKSRGGRS